MQKEAESPKQRESYEAVPFLPEEGEEGSHDESESLQSNPGSTPKRLYPWASIILITVVLGFDAGAQMIPGPILRIIESNVCRNHWRAHGPENVAASGYVAEDLCKIPEVQTEVTIVKGYSDLFERLSGEW